jgi:tetratricopeptide (TPR) repeat protein
MVDTYLDIRSGLAILVIGLLCTGCRPDADEPEAHRPGTPQADPQAATYLVEAQQALYRGAMGVALALVDSAEHQGGPKTDAFLADVAFLRGRIQGELHHAEAATRAYERVLELDPTYRGAWLNMGNLAFRRGQFNEALRYYRNEYDRYGDPKVLVYMGQGYAELGKVDSARYEYERAIQQDDSLAEAYIRLAVLHGNSGQVEQALSNAQRALALRPDDPDYRYIVGNTLLQSGNLAEAEAQLRRTIEQQPGHAKAHYSLGTVLARTGKQDEAKRYLARVDSLQQVEESINTFERRTMLYPDDPAAWVTYGYALSRAGRSSEAVRAFQVALFKGPATPDVHLLLANAYLKHRQPEEALAHYEAALQLDASFVGAWVNKGICLARMGKPEAARQAWETALRLDPDQPQVRAYLAGLTAP